MARLYGPVVLSTVAITSFSIAVVLTTSKSTGLCASDPNYLTRPRNWVNAGGTGLAAFVAALALVIAWGQFRASAVQAVLPIVNQRLITAKAIALSLRRNSSVTHKG